MSDKNYISFAGDDRGKIYLTRGDEPAVQLFAAEEPGIREYILDEGVAVNADGYSDALKLSGVTRFKLVVPFVDGRRCKEDAIDINHCADVEVDIGDLFAGQTYCGTIKGASKNVRVVVKRQHGHGRETDWDFGNAVDANISQARTTGCSLHVNTTDQSPVKVRILRAHRPAIENLGQRYDFDERLAGIFGTLWPILRSIAALFGKKI